MEIKMSISALKPKVQTGNPKRDLAKSPSGRQTKGAMSADDVAKVAESLLPAVKKTLQGRVSERTLKIAMVTSAENWAMNTRSKEFPEAARLKAVSRIATKMEQLYKKKAGASKKAPASAPSDKVVPNTKAATKDEKLKAQILAGTKLRNQFQGMLAKAPSMTAKSIENIRKHCDAYLKVINVVQKGKAELAETTKIEGLRGIESVKNYVNNVLGLTYGYVEIAKQLGVAQSALKDKINAGITVETSNVELKRTAKANAQRALASVAKALSRRNCQLPTSFQREVEKVFVDAAMSGDVKKAKELLRDRTDILVSEVFRNKTKLYSAK